MPSHAEAVVVRMPATRRSLLRRSRWLLARRISQLLVLALFMLGPWAGVWILRGTLASSQLLGLLGLTDPFVALQALVARRTLQAPALGGAAIVAALYMLAGGRAYCAWVCPINPVTDLASWLRVKLRLPALLRGVKPDRRLRHAVLLLAFVMSALLGGVAWEAVNPITLLQRALVFGLAGAWGVVLAVFLFDLLLLPRGWCGHLCPVGAFYGLLGRVSLVHVSAARRDACTQCGDCFRVCPEPHVIAPALYGAAGGRSPLIEAADCIRCARCLDVCDDDVFRIDWLPRRGAG
jgi:ferredoxin-type protein NapH